MRVLQRLVRNLNAGGANSVPPDCGPDARAFPHWHPGEEIIYVLERKLEYATDGNGGDTVGEALMVPVEKIHSVKNAGKGDAAELATY